MREFSAAHVLVISFLGPILQSKTLDEHRNYFINCWIIYTESGIIIKYSSKYPIPISCAVNVVGRWNMESLEALLQVIVQIDAQGLNNPAQM